MLTPPKSFLPIVFFCFLYLLLTSRKCYDLDGHGLKNDCTPSEQNGSESNTSQTKKSEAWVAQNTRIVLLRQQHIFDNQLFAVYEAFLQLNIPVEWADDFIANDSERIYITTMAPFMSQTPIKYISYNWEQLGTDKVWENDVYDRFRNALEVWDYSKINVEALAERGIDAKIILPGSAILDGSVFPLDENNKPRIKRDLDLVFIGTMNGRRTDFWNSVKDRSKHRRIHY